MGVVQGPDSDQDQNQYFERLVNQYQPSLLRTCYMYLRDQEQAKDAVQETFFKAYRNLGAFRGESAEKTWLMKIAVNTCHDMRKTAWSLHMDRRVTPEMLPEASVPFEEFEEGLIVEVMNLPLKLREVVLLYYYQNMDTNEIAETLGIARSSVSGRLQRARKKLRDVLEGTDSDEGQ
jgi:RNA polymerase sigma-70 factor (ECF subfamily)